MPALPKLVSALVIMCSIAALTGCGGSGGGSDDGDDDPDTGGGTTQPNPFSVDSYAEYRDGDDLSGIWMMIINTEQASRGATGTTIATESFRSAVFIKENPNGSYSYLDVSNPFCEPSVSPLSAVYSGNNVRVNMSRADLDLTVIDYSRMSGSLANYCRTCSTTPSDVQVEMIKVAPLPPGNWYYHFGNAQPSIGSIRGMVQSDATTDAYEFDDDINCFAHSKGHGMQRYIAHYMTAATGSPDYESIIVTTKGGDGLYVTEADGVLAYDGVRRDEMGYFKFSYSQQTRNFEMTVEGLNPTVINISADASVDASSDGAELDIRIDY